MKQNVTLKGNKKAGFIVTIYGRDGFIGDLAITFPEAKLLKELLKIRVK